MNLILDIFSTVSIFFALYFMFFFFLVFSSNRKNFFKRPKIKRFPSVSVIIPAYNEGERIAKTIQNIKRLIYPKKLDIIVIDDGSTDNTYEAAKSLKAIRVFSKSNEGKASALNFGLKKAKGEIVVCIDSDSYPERRALLKAIPNFEDNVVAVTTTVLAKKSKKIIQRFQKIEYLLIAGSRKLLEYLNAIYVTPGPMSLYKRDVLISVGGFDEKNLTEDIEIAWRLLSKGYKIKMDLGVKVFTELPTTLKKWWHQRLRWNVGGIQTTLKYKGLLFKKGFGSLGTFVLPFFSMSYVLSIFGFFIILYVIYQFFNSLLGSYIYGFNLFHISEFYFLPDTFLFLAVLTLLSSFVYMAIFFSAVRSKVNVKNKFLDYALYIFAYFSLFPLNLFHSYFKFLTRRYEW